MCLRHVSAVSVLVVACWASGARSQDWGAPVDLGGNALASGPSAMTGPFVTDPGAAVGSPSIAGASGRRITEVYYRGPDGKLWVRGWNGSQWNSPASMGPATGGQYEPSAVYRGWPDVDVAVFYVGLNGRLWTIWRSAYGLWSPPTDLGGATLDGAPSAIRGGTTGAGVVEVYFRGENGHLHQRVCRASGSCDPAVDLGGVSLTSAPVAVAGGQHPVDVLFRGPDGQLWSCFWPATPGSNWWSGQSSRGGPTLTSAPSAIANGPQRVDVFYSGPNNTLWTTSGAVSTEFHRYVNTATSRHFYTTNPAELAGSTAYRSEPSLGFIHKTPLSGTLPLYRYRYLGSGGGHFYSTNQTEVGTNGGYAAEGVAGYVYATSHAGRRPVYRYGNRTHAEHFYTHDYSELGAGNTTWAYEGIAFYVLQYHNESWTPPADLGGEPLRSAPTAVAAGSHEIDVFFRGANDRLWTRSWPDRPWIDVQRNVNIIPAHNAYPYDFVTRDFDPDNGYALNPRLRSQVWSAPNPPSPSLCANSNPWVAPCTSQVPTLNTNRGLCPTGALGGHANWGVGVFEGAVSWGIHSWASQDDDYSINLYRPDRAYSAAADVNRVHMEFAENETVDGFDTYYWQALWDATRADDAGDGIPGVGSGLPVPPYTHTRALLDGKEVIALGVVGLDCAHSCGSELHPVYAFAVHDDGSNPLDDKWAIFVRNWGDEGYCSRGVLELGSGAPLTFKFRLKRPGAQGVTVRFSDASDTRGQYGTVFRRPVGHTNTRWFMPYLIENEGAVITLQLPPPSDRSWIEGMLHLTWDMGMAPTTCAAEGKNCDAIPDGTGGSVNCGTCAPPEVCGGGGVANVCGACEPNPNPCGDRYCGEAFDGCSTTVSCGSCANEEICNSNGQCESIYVRPLTTRASPLRRELAELRAPERENDREKKGQEEEEETVLGRTLERLSPERRVSLMARLEPALATRTTEIVGPSHGAPPAATRLRDVTVVPSPETERFQREVLEAVEKAVASGNPKR